MKLTLNKIIIFFIIMNFNQNLIAADLPEKLFGVKLKDHIAIYADKRKYKESDMPKGTLGFKLSTKDELKEIKPNDIFNYYYLTTKKDLKILSIEGIKQYPMIKSESFNNVCLSELQKLNKTLADLYGINPNKFKRRDYKVKDDTFTYLIQTKSLNYKKGKESIRLFIRCGHIGVKEQVVSLLSLGFMTQEHFKKDWAPLLKDMKLISNDFIKKDLRGL